MRREAGRAAQALRATATRAETPSDVIDAAFAADGPLGIEPLQVRSELDGFLALVRAERPRNVLEIGAGSGGMLYLLGWASGADARLLSLDRRVYPSARRRLCRRFAAGKRRAELVEADSHLEATRARVERFFRGRPLDLLFVDGDHGYESVARDYELYGPLLRDGGLVAFHDIVDGPPEAVGGVPRFWRELRPTLAEPREFVESWQQGGFGIGVGRRGRAEPSGEHEPLQERAPEG